MGMVYRQAGRKVWQLKYYRNGRPIYESSHTTSKREAEAILKRREGKIADGEHVSARMHSFRFDDAIKDVLTDYRINRFKSVDEAERRVRLHLAPFFAGRRMVAIDTALIRSYIDDRQQAGVVAARGPRKGERVRDVSNAEINRELDLLRKAFKLAIKDRKLVAAPHIPALDEDNVRRGFFEPDQVAAVCRQLPAELAAVVRFASITGWRIASEVLPLTWAQVDFTARLSPDQQTPGVVRLEVGTTKNREGRSFPFTEALRAVLLERRAAADALKAERIIVPFVFFRLVAAGRGGPKRPRRIVAFTKAWRAACVAAGVPGRVPHDLRRTAVRALVRAGVPQSVAMKLTGHKTASVFRRYDITADVDLASAANKLDGTVTATVTARHSGRRKSRPNR